MIALTARAAERTKVLLSKEGKPGGVLRLRVVAGGCSGLSYQFDLCEAPKPSDLVSETDGARLAVDAKAAPYVEGSTVDFVKTLMRQGYEIRNPKAATSCSCGTSFSVETESFSV